MLEKSQRTDLAPVVMCKFTRPCQDASQSRSVCCRLDPHCAHLLRWLEILRLDTFNYQDVIWAKSAWGRQEHCREYDSLFQSVIPRNDRTTLDSSENDTQKVAYVSQGHWNCRRPGNTVSPPHFADRTLRNRGDKSSCGGFCYWEWC